MSGSGILLIALAAAALAAEAWLCVLAKRRWVRSQQPQDAHARPSCWLELVALVPLIVVLAAGAICIHAARVRLRTHWGNDAQVVGDALYTELTSIVAGGLGAVPVALLSGIALGLAISARLQRASPAAHPGRQAWGLIAVAGGLVCASLLPLIWAGVSAALHTLHMLEQSSTLDPIDKLGALEAARQTARAELSTGFSVAVVLILAAASGGCALLWWALPSQPILTTRADLGLAAAALLLALALTRASAPLQRELELPWPPGNSHGLGVSTAIPPLEGPDPIALGPVLEIRRDALVLDRVQLSEESLPASLQALRRQFGVLHPSEPFQGEFLVICDPSTPAQRVFDVMAHAAQAGYRQPTFACEVRRALQRPVLGSIELRRASGARASLAAAPSETTLQVRAGDATTCASLVERIVSARRQGAAVALQVPDQPPTAAR
ncbi:MAG TPA: hypothetical protein VJR89_13010 [Polyangiales bacterium]|nr:hypothetical protein [Polyangiales bacterium]